MKMATHILNLSIYLDYFLPSPTKHINFFNNEVFGSSLPYSEAGHLHGVRVLTSFCSPHKLAHALIERLEETLIGVCLNA